MIYLKESTTDCLLFELVIQENHSLRRLWLRDVKRVCQDLSQAEHLEERIPEITVTQDQQENRSSSEKRIHALSRMHKRRTASY